MDKKIILLFWIIFILVYSVNILKFNIFEDEAQYLLLAEAIVENPTGNFFIYIENGLLPLFGWIVAAFTKVLGDSLLVGRMVDVFLASTLIFWAYFIGKAYDLPKRFIIYTGLLFIASPILVLHSRVSILDIPILVFTSWYIYFTIRLLEKPDRAGFFGFTLSLLFAFLTKATAILGIPVVLYLVFSHLRAKKKLDRGGGYILGILLRVGCYTLLFLLVFGDQIIRDSGSSIITQLPWYQVIDRVKINFWLTFNWSIIYFFQFLLPLVIFILFFKNLKRGNIYTIVFIWIISNLLITIISNRFYFTRHTLILSAALILFAATVLSEIPKKIALVCFIIILILKGGLVFEILIRPEDANIALEDHSSYFEDYTSGVNLDNIVRKLELLAKEEEITVWLDGTYVMEYGLRYKLSDNQRAIVKINFKSFRLGEKNLVRQSHQVDKVLDQKTYVLVNKYFPANIDQLKLIDSFPAGLRGGQKLYVYE